MSSFSTYREVYNNDLFLMLSVCVRACARVSCVIITCVMCVCVFLPGTTWMQHMAVQIIRGEEPGDDQHLFRKWIFLEHPINAQVKKKKAKLNLIFQNV